MTKVLIYIEPLIEAGMPNVRMWWLKFAEDNLKALLGNDCDYDSQCRVVMSDYFKVIALSGKSPIGIPDLSYWASFPEENIVTYSIQDCWDMFGEDGTSTARRWSDGRYTSDELDASSLKLRDKLGEFIPDLVITFSNVPFVENAFPDAVVMHQEAGMLSQAPYPSTLYFDPVGMKRTSSLRKFSSELKFLEVTDSVERGVNEFRHAFIKDCLVPRSPFAHLKEELRDKFDSIWIWPNQWHYMAGWGGELPMQHMWDMMTWVLDKAGPKNGIIFTDHPSDDIYFTKKRVCYWQKLFPNFIFIEDAWKISAATQFLMDIVDGVICLNSAVGFQPLFWKKKLITIGETQFRDMADATELDNLNDLAKAAWDSQKDAQLYWLLTQFNVLSEDLLHPNYFRPFVERCISAKRREGDIPFSVFQPYKEPKQIISEIITKGNYQVPRYWKRNLFDFG